MVNYQEWISRFGGKAPKFILAISILLTLLSCGYVQYSIHRENQIRFNFLTRELVAKIRGRLERYENALIHTKVLFHTNPKNDRALFESYVNELGIFQRYPGIQGIGYVQKIQASEIAKFEKAQHDEGITNFKVWPIDPRKEEYFPILYMEPSDWRNQRAIGYDMTSDPIRNDAMTRARDTGEPAMSGNVRLVQETKDDQQVGFLIYVPVFRNQAPLNTVDERRKAHVGYIHSAYRSIDFFRALLSGEQSTELKIDLEVFGDASGKSDLLYDHDLTFDHGTTFWNRNFTRKAVIKFGGSQWSVIFHSYPSFIPATERYAALAVFIVGLILSAAFYSLTRALYQQLEKERRQDVELLLKSEALENSLNAFDIVDSSGKFVYVNKAYVRMWGYDSAEEIIGTSPAGHCVDPDVPAKITGEIQTKGECDIEFLAKRKDGSHFNVRMWARKTLDFNGQEMYPSTSIDITKQVKSDKEIKRALEERDLSLRARDEFLSIASHELKTPLTTLKLQFQMVSRRISKDDPEVLLKDNIQKLVNQTNQQLVRLTGLIEDMLDVSRIATGKLQLKLAPVDLGTLVRETVERFMEQFRSEGIEFTSQIIQDKVVVSADKFRLEQVLDNLLTNAIKYGNKKPSIISLRRDEKTAFIEVKDQGLGINEEDRARIFQRFERASTTTNISGLGIGLYVSGQIVEAHGGKIKVESETGKGSTFIVALPLT